MRAVSRKGSGSGVIWGLLQPQIDENGRPSGQESIGGGAPTENPCTCPGRGRDKLGRKPGVERAIHGGSRESHHLEGSPDAEHYDPKGTKEQNCNSEIRARRRGPIT